MEAKDPVSVDMYGLEQIRKLTNSNQTLDHSLENLNIKELTQLLEETKSGVFFIKSHLVAKESLSVTLFHCFMDKILFSKDENENLPLSNTERFFHLVKTFSEYSLGILGVFSIFVTDALWTLYAVLVPPVILGTSAAAFELYSYQKENNNYIYEKKLLNLQVEILKKLNRKIFFNFFNKLEKSLGIEFSIDIHNQNFSSNFIAVMLNKKIQEKNGHILKDKIIKKLFQEVMDELANKNSILNQSIKFNHNNNPYINELKSYKIQKLTFFQWFNTKKSSIIKNAILSSAFWQGLGIIGAFKIASGFSAFSFLAAFSATPLGLAIIIGVTSGLVLIISAINIYKDYKEAVRKEAKSVITSVLSKEEEIKNGLLATQEKVVRFSKKFKKHKNDDPSVSNNTNGVFSQTEIHSLLSNIDQKLTSILPNSKNTNNVVNDDNDFNNHKPSAS